MSAQPKQQLPKISVIVSNFNGAKYLPRLLDTLQAQRGVSVEVVVVDRNSTDASASILAEHPSVRVVSESPESGLVSGYAIGAEHATQELLFFCNEDMWFDADCLQRLAEKIDLSKRIAAVDPWQWTYDGKTWIHGGTRFLQTSFDLNCPYPFRSYDFTRELDSGDEIPFGCAGAILMHRSVYQELGGWDRSFFLDHEDVDLFVRAWQANWRCVTAPNAKVYHAVNVSNAKKIANGRQLVSRRRYISGRSSIPILGVKYFSPRYSLLQALILPALAVHHIATLRFRQAYWDCLAAVETLRRLGPAWGYRRRHAQDIKDRPGELFFSERVFQG